MLFSSPFIKGTYYQHDLSLCVWGFPGQLAEVVRCLQCKVTCVSSFHTLLEGRPREQPTLKKETIFHRLRGTASIWNFSA